MAHKILRWTADMEIDNAIDCKRIFRRLTTNKYENHTRAVFIIVRLNKLLKSRLILVTAL